MSFSQWLEEERGRAAYLADRLGLSRQSVSFMKTNGVPYRHMKVVSELTEIPVETLVLERNGGE